MKTYDLLTPKEFKIIKGASRANWKLKKKIGLIGVSLMSLATVVSLCERPWDSPLSLFDGRLKESLPYILMSIAFLNIYEISVRLEIIKKMYEIIRGDSVQSSIKALQPTPNDVVELER